MSLTQPEPTHPPHKPARAASARASRLTAEAMPARIRSTLRRRFGLKQLREGQEEVITRVLGGQDTLAIMPTGAGKSLCYQLPALLLPGCTLVVSPLIALMKDQCEALCDRGIEAVQFNSAVDAQALHAAECAVADGRARIVLATPERLSDPGFIALMAARTVSLLVVDEAHCISQWGHDFRPAFLEIAPALEKLGQPTVLALTATATEAVTADIAAQLHIARAGIVNTGAYRANLHFRVEQVAREDEKPARLLALLRAQDGSGLVYTATVRAAEAVYDALRAADESVLRYHGRLSAAERAQAQDDFMSGKARIMVATNAFGLGIDKADIRFVVHYQMPAGLDAYYQEAGRAGRDGADANCTLLFLRSDKAVQQFFLGGRYPSAAEVDALYRALQHSPAHTGQLRPDEHAGKADAWTLPQLQEHLGFAMNKVKVAASLLRRQRIAGADGEGRLRLLKASLDDRALQSLMTAYRDKRELDQATLEAMVFYAQTGQCRWEVLLDHLQDGEASRHAACGSCDNCLRIAALQAELAERAQATVQTLTDGPAAIDAAVTPPASAPFRADDAVKVRRYGRGRVVSADALSVTVAFETGEQRSFGAAYVQRVAPGRRKAMAAPSAVAAVAA